VRFATASFIINYKVYIVTIYDYLRLDWTALGVSEGGDESAAGFERTIGSVKVLVGVWFGYGGCSRSI
jgi:hypothetical protein